MTTKGTPRPGDLAVHREGGLVVLRRRKTQDEPNWPGWWVEGRRGGLADRVLAGPDWRHVPAGEVRAWAWGATDPEAGA